MSEKKERTTMSVEELRQLFGIVKSEAYWLVHKGYFKTVLINGKMRIVIADFEKWYANQMKYRKLDGPPPGEELRRFSYSVAEMAELLGISKDIVYTIIKRDKIETFKVDDWMRIRRDVFEDWYQSQNVYRTAEDRQRDAGREAASMTMPEIAKLLRIPRKEVYSILNSKANRGVFEYDNIADRKRITKESFERWYRSQNKYRKYEDLPPEEQVKILREQKEAERPQIKVPLDKAAYTMQETMMLMELSREEIMNLIHCGELEAKKYGGKYMIRRDDIKWWLHQQKMNEGK